MSSSMVHIDSQRTTQIQSPMHHSRLKYKVQVVGTDRPWHRMCEHISIDREHNISAPSPPRHHHRGGSGGLHSCILDCKNATTKIVFL